RRGRNLLRLRQQTRSDTLRVVAHPPFNWRHTAISYADACCLGSGYGLLFLHPPEDEPSSDRQHRRPQRVWKTPIRVHHLSEPMEQRVCYRSNPKVHGPPGSATRSLSHRYARRCRKHRLTTRPREEWPYRGGTPDEVVAVRQPEQ